MCGIAGIFGSSWNRAQLETMTASQRHRGPDAEGVYVSSNNVAGLGHNRLSIVDLSLAGRQPMSNYDERLWIVFNGEIYNYRELRAELDDYPYRSQTDTEVILAAYERWGEACLDRFIGMFAFLIWDERQQRLFAARDRFGVKPLNYHLQADGTLLVASEIKALHAAGVSASPDAIAWATYLTSGAYDHSSRTFWETVNSLPPGYSLTWQDGQMSLSRWYDLAERVGRQTDDRPLKEVEEEYLALLVESVRLRFRSDVAVGINLSGGLDSSLLLNLVHRARVAQSDVKVFTFVTGDARYDELPWVEQMLKRTHHPLVVCNLRPADVPALAQSVQKHQEEPFGGLPTLAYACLFEQARAAEGVTVLLDGQGMDEQWCGYDYYSSALNGNASALVQGAKDKTVLSECLTPEFRALSEPLDFSAPFGDPLRDLQYRDVRYTKLPRALRFNDRISMRSSTELREPFLDHRLFELALRQPPERKIFDGTHKWFLRHLTEPLLRDIATTPKRPLQTPQREWLRGPLKDWAGDYIQKALAARGGSWIEAGAVRSAWENYCAGRGDNSFYVWQWISVGLMSDN